MSSDQGIKKLFEKYIAIENTHKINKITNFPEIPPKTRGHVFKKSGLFNRSKLRYLEIDPINGVLNRFKNLQNFNNKRMVPIETIPLIDIEYCKRLENTKDYTFEVI